MSMRLYKLALLASVALSPAAAFATGTAIILSGDYIKLSANSLGTLGQGNTSPGLLFDASGTGTFNAADDYLTPGTPFEGFSVKIGSTTYSNNNSSFSGGSGAIAGTLTDLSGTTADHRAVWTGTQGSNFTITNEVSFNDDSKALKITTTIQALTNLTGVTFSRQTDPDVNTSYTSNVLGAGSISAADIAVSTSAAHGYVLSIYSNDATTHHAGVSSGWSQDPATYLSGTNNGNGDYVIGMGFDLGNMTSGQSISFSYYYLFGASLADLDAIVTNVNTGGALKAGVVDNTLPGTGPVTVDGQTLTYTSDYAVTSEVVAGAGNATIDTAGHSGTISGTISGAGALTKTGDGALTLSGVNSYTGGTIVSGGMLVVSDGAALGSSSSSITVSGGTLRIEGTTNITQSLQTTTADSAVSVAPNMVATVTGTVSGNACLTKTGSGTLVLAANGSNSIGACVEQGILSNNAIFTGNVSVNTNGTLRGTGQIRGTVINTGTIAPGNSPGTLTVNGSVTQQASSTLQIDIDGAGAGAGAGNYSRLIVTGAGNSFTAAGTLLPKLRGITGNASNTYTPAIGTSFTIVEAEGGVNGSFSTLTQPASGLLAGSQFKALYSLNSVILTVVPVSYAALPTVTLSGNGAAAGQAVDAVIAANPATPLQVGLAGQAETQLAQTLQQMSGEVHADVVMAGLEGRRLARRAVAQRLASARASASENRRNLWVQGIGRSGTVRADKSAGGYRYNAGGIAFGGDMGLRHGLRIGAGISALRGDINARAMGSGDANHVQGFVYGSWESGRGYYVDTVVAHSWDRYKTSRVAALSTGALAYDSRSNGHNWAADLTVGRYLNAGKYMIQPELGLRWDQVQRNAVIENGDARAQLSLSAKDDNVVQGRLGLRASRNFTARRVAITPELRAYWLHSFHGDGVYADLAQLGGQNIAVHSAMPGRDAALLGAGANLQLSQTVRLFVNYDAQLQSGATTHNLTGGLRVSF